MLLQSGGNGQYPRSTFARPELRQLLEVAGLPRSLKDLGLKARTSYSRSSLNGVLGDFLGLISYYRALFRIFGV